MLALSQRQLSGAMRVLFPSTVRFFGWPRRMLEVQRPHQISKMCYGIDFLLDTGPCQPFTCLRPRRGHTAKTDSVSNHPDLVTTVHEWLQVVENLRPKGGIKENVLNIASACKDCPEGSTSWADFLIQELRSLGYVVWVVRLDNALFIDCARKRWFLVYLSPQLGGGDALMWMRARLQDRLTKS